jgi:hypothetical protein
VELQWWDSLNENILFNWEVKVMTYQIAVQNIEVSAEKFKSIELYLSEEEYEQIKLDNTAFIQAILDALEASNE